MAGSMPRLRYLSDLLSFGFFSTVVLLAFVVRVGADGEVGSEPGIRPSGDGPRIFIGTAWPDRLEELRDKSQWAEVAPHVGLFVHPENINPNSSQIELLKELSPCFGVREAIIERNAIPTADDVEYRIDLMRNTLNFKSQLYFYINSLFAEGEKVTADRVPTPAPELYERARQMRAMNVVPLFSVTPHVVFRTPGGFSDPGWDFLRDFSVLEGYCFDAPAELYMRTGKNERQQNDFERYRAVAAEAIRYANSRGKYSIYLFGAHKSAEENVRFARDVVRDLKRRDALPWAWGIEDYSKNSALHMVPERNADGTHANTVTGLALWIRDFYAGKVE